MAAHAMASMAGLRGTSQGVLEGSLRLSGSTGLNLTTNARAAVSRSGFNVVRAQQQAPADPESWSFVQAVFADAIPIKVGPPPPPSGGLRKFNDSLTGTLNSDQPRDLELPLKQRFFLQPLPPAEAASRAKESAKGIHGVKALIDKKAWPYVQNDLRLRAEYLRYDLNTVIAAKPQGEKQSLKELTGKLFQTISNLDYAAKKKNTPETEQYYAETVSALSDVLAKLG